MKTKPTLTFAAILIAALLCLTSCGSTTQNASLNTDTADATSGSAEAITEKAEEIAGPKIEDIDRSIDETVVDGERMVAFSYVNNSDYSICGMEITFTEKDGITSEEREAFFEDIKIILELDETNEDDVKDFERLKKEPISLHTELNCYTKVGDESVYEDINYYKGYRDVEDIAHISLVEPDIMTVKFVDDGKIKTVYYDFKAGKYTLDKKTEDAQYWTTGTLGTVIPKPEAEVVMNDMDEEDSFYFDVYGWTDSDFNAYIEKCKATGFTVDAYTGSDSFYASNAEMYNIDLYFDASQSHMSASVTAPAG